MPHPRHELEGNIHIQSKWSRKTTTTIQKEGIDTGVIPVVDREVKMVSRLRSHRLKVRSLGRHSKPRKELMLSLPHSCCLGSRSLRSGQMLGEEVDASRSYARYSNWEEI